MKLAIASRSPMTKRTAFILFSLMAMGCFGFFSRLELNGFLKYYGLLLSLQGGFAVVYAVQRSRRSRANLDYS